MAGATTLSYGVRPRIVAKYFGQLSIMLGLLTAVPLGVSLSFQDYAAATRYGAVIVVLILFAIPLGSLPGAGRIRANEALVVIASIFIAAPLLMSYPLMAAGLPFLDALFEAVSAVTTTGLTTLKSVEDMPPAFLFARAWMQWYGGLGIVVLSVALLMGHHMAAKRLAEPTSGEQLVTTTREHAIRIMRVYGILTIGGIIAILTATGADFFTALTHTLAAVSTGGFSTHDDSLAGFSSWTGRLTVSVVAFLGAVPLPLYYMAYRCGWREITDDAEVRTLVFLALSLGVLLAVTFYVTSPLAPADALAHGLAMGLSAQSTTGFSTLPVGQLHAFALLLMVFAMAIGGGVASTAGGIKVLRLIMMLRLIQLVMQRTALPAHAVSQARLEGRVLRMEDTQRALVMILLFVGVILLSWLVFLGFGHEPLGALFEVTSATGTVGLSTGLTSADLHPALKLVLCLDMLLGRLEVVAILVLFYPPTWLSKRTEA